MKATVSGSFHRHIAAIYSAVGELIDAGFDVLSPNDPRVVGFIREFLFVASDKTRLKKQVQQRHLSAITHSDFLWLVCPDGYVGMSAAMEIGWAANAGIPVYSKTRPSDVTLEDFVTVVSSPAEAFALIDNGRRAVNCSSLLLEPEKAAAQIGQAAQEISDILSGKRRLSPVDATLLIELNTTIVSNAFEGINSD